MNLIPRKFYLDSMFDDLLSNTNSNMKCDIYEKDNNYYIEMDVPGFKKEEINIECNDGYLKISASKSEEKSDENKNYLRRERQTSEYSREFYLGKDINEESIKAEFKDGTLNVTIPKKEELSNTKKIEIE